MTRMVELILAVTVVIIHGYTTFIIDFMRKTFEFVASFIQFVKNMHIILIWIVHRLPTTLDFGLLVLILRLLWEMVTVIETIAIKLDRFDFMAFMESFDAWGLLENIADVFLLSNL